MKKLAWTLVQVHGQVADDLFENLPCASIQAVQVDGEGMYPILRQTIYSLMPCGWSGQTFDWVQLDTTGLTQPFFIAGGLNEDNVVKAIQHFTPLCSRCISGSGDRRTKDHEKIRRFIERAKEWHIKNQIKMDLRKIRRTFRPRNINDSSFGVGGRPTVKVRQTQVSKRN